MMLATPYSQRRRLQFRVCVPHSQRNAYAQTLSTDDRVDHERQKAAFASLLEPVLSLAYRVAYNLARHEANAEELVQDASILAFRHFESFEHGTNFKAWFMKILKNSFLMEARRRKRYPQTIDLSDLPDSYLYSQALAANLYATTPDPAAAMLQHVTATQLSQAMGQLPEEYHLVSVFYFVEELSYREIAEYLEIPIGTVRSRLHRGRRMLQKILWPIAQESGLFANPRSDAKEHHESV